MCDWWDVLCVMWYMMLWWLWYMMFWNILWWYVIYDVKSVKNERVCVIGHLRNFEGKGEKKEFENWNEGREESDESEWWVLRINQFAVI